MATKTTPVTLGRRGGPVLGARAVARFMRVGKTLAARTGKRVAVKSFTKGSARTSTKTFGARTGAGGAGGGGG